MQVVFGDVHPPLHSQQFVQPGTQANRKPSMTNQDSRSERAARPQFDDPELWSRPTENQSPMEPFATGCQRAVSLPVHAEATRIERMFQQASHSCAYSFTGVDLAAALPARIRSTMRIAARSGKWIDER